MSTLQNVPPGQPENAPISGGRASAPADRGAAKFLMLPVRAALGLPRWVQATILVLMAGTVIPFGAIGNVPDSLLIGRSISNAIDGAVDWMVDAWNPFFKLFRQTMLDYLLLPLERWLHQLPWWLVTGVVSYIAYRMVGLRFGVLALVMMTFVALLGLFSLAMSTLALVITAAVLAVALGVPAGLLAAKNDRFEMVVRPVLDAMQTMPTFVYLIPVVMLLGIGMVPALLATLVYAVPPIIRLTNLGIREVDGSIVEAARAFGATPLQVLFKVEIPLAIPTIMAGLNQTIMMALAMVVIASIIGARGLGEEVLNGIARLDVGRGLLGGLGIVVMAIILDRVTQGLAKPRRPGGRSGH